VVAPDAHGSRDPGATAYTEDALYDLQADPYELNNLIGYASHEGVAQRMRQRLLDRMAQAGEDQSEILAATPRPSGQKIVLEGEVEQ
jgi:hypothetical protein